MLIYYNFLKYILEAISGLFHIIRLSKCWLLLTHLIYIYSILHNTFDFFIFVSINQLSTLRIPKYYKGIHFFIIVTPCRY